MAEHTIRVAGLEDGYRKHDGDLHETLSDVRKFLMEFGGGWFLPDVFQNLREHADDDRLLIAERISAGRPVIDGCIAYTLQDVFSTDPATGEPDWYRVNMLRILAVREGPGRGELARRLASEAQLRGTIRSIYDNPDAPQAIGTVGVIMEGNKRALRWARRLRPGAQLITPQSSVVHRDPTLSALRDFAETVRMTVGKGLPYRFVLANRISLVAAAAFHLAGRVPSEPGADGLSVAYDPTDPLEEEIYLAALNILRRIPGTLARLALDGDPTSTVWGPTKAENMRIRGAGGAWKRLGSPI